MRKQYEIYSLIFPLSKSGGLWFYFFHTCLDKFNILKYLIIICFKMYVVFMHAYTEVHLCTIQLLGSSINRCCAFMSSDHSPGVNIRGYLSSNSADWDIYVLVTIGMKDLSFFQGNCRKTTVLARCFQVRG